MFYRKSILLFLLSIGISFPVIGQEGALSTMGTDFWLTFLPNNNQSFGTCRVYVSSTHNCTIALENPDWGVISQTSVIANQITEINVPRSLCLTYNVNSITNTGLHLSASDTVSVFATNLHVHNYEACNIFPTNVLRDSYMIQTYPNSGMYGCVFSVVAVEDSTTVDIVLSAPAYGATSTTQTVMLPRAGNCYQMRSYVNGDFSGTTITSRDCKPIAVFQGNICVYIPEWDDNQTCDHVVEQAIPIVCLGRHFVLVSTNQFYHPDHVRITAIHDGTEVRRNNVLQHTINAGNTYEYTLSSSVNMRGVDYISTNHPVIVNNFFESSDGSYGDPSMVTIMPIEQMIRNITFMCVNTNATTTHYVNVVVKDGEQNQLRLDGEQLFTYHFPYVVGNPTYRYCNILVSSGTHTLSMDGGSGFSAYVYGLGDYESYAYSVGSTMNDISSMIYVNGSFSGMNDQSVVCKETEVDFHVEYDDAPLNIRWNFGDGDSATGNNQTHIYDQPGVYRVSAELNYGLSRCFSNMDTLYTFVDVHNPDTVDTQLDFCDSALFGGMAYYTDTTCCRLAGTSEYGCDSIERGHLMVHHSYFLQLPQNGCDSVVYQGRVYRNSGITDTFAYSSIYGCDSIVEIVTRVNPSYDNVAEVSLTMGDTLQWIDGGYYSSPTDSASYLYHSVDGCDSLVHLHLVMKAPAIEPPPPDSSALWVPNVFTPENQNNKLFQIFSNDLIEAKVWIFDRRGSFVTSFDGLADAWDGTSEGRMCKSDVYVYLIEYVTKAKPQYKQRKTGTVLLLK